MEAPQAAGTRVVRDLCPRYERHIRLRRVRPRGGVVAWMGSVDLAELAVSAATIGEIQIGIERTRDLDPNKAIEIETWLDDLLHRMPVLPSDADLYRVWARIMHRKPAELSEDAMIGATALRYGCNLVTRNVRDFKNFGVTVLNRFEYR